MTPQAIFERNQETGGPRRVAPADATAAYSASAEFTAAEFNSAGFTAADFDGGDFTAPRAARASADASEIEWPAPHDHYRVLGEIAAGGMGLVLRVHDAAFDRTLAVKVLLPGQRTAAAEGRFLEEARITGRLQHPGIPPAHEVGRLKDGRPYFSMKLIEGRTLADLLEQRPSPRHDLPRFLKIFEQVAQTLAYAHAQGVIHRDVKPLNVMVGAFGEVQLMDWGLAKRLAATPHGDDAPAPLADFSPRDDSPPLEQHTVAFNEDATDGRTQHGAVLGTLAFMAPEQARGEVQLLDARCDVFGLGALLCAVLTGAPPYRQPRMAEVWQAAREADLADALSRLAACGADDELARLAESCLAPRAKDRPADAGEVAARIASYLASVQQRLETARLAQAQAEVKAGEESKRRRLVVLLAAALVTLVAGGGAFGVWYVNDQARREREQAERRQEKIRAETELASRKNYLAQEIGTALDEAAAFRGRLQLNDPQQAALLLSELEQWRMLVFEAAAALKRAETLAAGSRELLPQDLSTEMTVLSQDLARDEAERRLAVELDRIRFECSSPVAGGNIELWRAAPQLDQVFRDAGFDFEDESAPQLAERLRASAIRLPLVAALDFWALVSRDALLREKLLETARLADPDPWRDRLRNPDDWRDREKLATLVKEVDFAAQSPQLLAAVAQRLRLAGGDAPEFLRRALAHHPRDFWLFFELGHGSRDPSEQIGAFRSALAVRPESAYAYYGLGVVFQAERKLDLAEEYYRRAIELDPQSAGAHNNLGLLLSDQQRLDEAEACYRRSIELDPESATAHANLGALLRDRGDRQSGIDECRRALEIDPRCAAALINLGVFLREDDRVDEAIQTFRRAVEAAPGNALAHLNLGHSLRQLGRFREALEELSRGHELGSRQPGWKHPSAQWVAETQRQIVLDEMLPAILAGEPPPSEAGDLLLLADICLMQHKRYATAARFFETAFAADPELAEDLQNNYRYNAACAASLAAEGKGQDALDLSDEQRADLLKLARAWLTADLAAWAGQLEHQPARAEVIVRTLDHWHSDPDLGGIREESSLALLPRAEQTALKKLWAEVEALKQEARAAERVER